MNTYYIGSRKFTHIFSSLNKEFFLNKNKNYLFYLNHLSVLNIIGENSREFLQGQISCDMNEVTVSTIRHGTICNLRGNIISLLDIIYWNNNIKIILPTDLLNIVITSLRKAAMLSKIKMQVSNKYYIYGLYLMNYKDIVPNYLDINIFIRLKKLSVFRTKNLFCYYLGNNLYILLIYKNLRLKFHEVFIQYNQLRGSLIWHKIQIETINRFMIYRETNGIFTPNKIDIYSNFICLTKGCYRGQEIIASLYYRSQLKYTVKVMIFIGKSNILFPGKNVVNNNKIIIGKIIDFCPINENNNYITIISVIDIKNNFYIQEDDNNFILLE